MPEGLKYSKAHMSEKRILFSRLELGSQRSTFYTEEAVGELTDTRKRATGKAWGTYNSGLGAASIAYHRIAFLAGNYVPIHL